MASSLRFSLALLLVAIAAPGCAETPPAKAPEPGMDPAEQKRIEAGRAKMDEAGRALDDKKLDLARKLLKEAKALAVDSQQFEIAETLEKVDKRHAKLWATEVSEKLTDPKDCLAGVADLGKPMKELQSEVFDREVRKIVGTETGACVQRAVKELAAAAKFDAARKLAHREDVVAVLGPAASKKLETDLEAQVVEALRVQIQPDITARKWLAAFDKIEGAKKRGDATAEQQKELFASLRGPLEPDIAALAVKAIGQNKGAEALVQVDTLIRLGGWEPSPDVAAPPDKALPAALKAKRGALAVWVELKRVGGRPLPKAEKRWAHGAVPLAPAHKSDGAVHHTMNHAREVWVIAASKDRALVVEKDPGGASLADRLEKASGWADSARLPKESTVDWLVPDDQLKGERVWAPLRPPDTIMELGVVVDVSGKDVGVRRLADDSIVKVARQKLRNGRLTPGTRVITFCTAKDQPAKVMELKLSQRSVQLKCDSGEEKEEMLPSLRAKADQLPATR